MTMTATAPTPSMMLSALWYVRQGFAVFPLWWPNGGRCACPKGDACPSPAKHPMTATGFHDASADEDQPASCGGPASQPLRDRRPR
jgi:hypothetical protein